MIRGIRTNLSVDRRPLQVVAALMAVLFLVLAAFAASADLHEAIHADAKQPDHQCAIKILAQGQVEAPPCNVLAAPPDVWSQASLPITISLGHATLDLLPPGRAPPFVS